jgi:hypothetical protein
MAKHHAGTFQIQNENGDFIKEVASLGEYTGEFVFNPHIICTNFTFVEMKSSDEYIFKCDDCGKEMRLTFGSKGGK